MNNKNMILNYKWIIFEIDSSTGVITITAGHTLNYEAASVHNLTVTATDGTLSDTATITVNVNDLIVEAVDDVKLLI